MTSTSRGIDVSAYQGPQNWAERKTDDGLVFAFAKASEGQKTRDQRFPTHIKAIKAASLVRGAYHFGWPNQDVTKEANNYIAAVRPYAGRGFVHALDLERYSDGRNYRGRSDTQIAAWAKRWVQLVEAAFPGQRVIIYTSGDDIARGHLPASVPLWYPAYPGSRVDTFAEAEKAARPKPSGRSPLIWQFTSDPAGSDHVDSNIAYMAPAAFREWANGDDDQDDDGKTYTPPAFPNGLAPNKAAPSAVGLQRALKAAGFMAKSVKESPNYGPATQAAVVKFHNAHPTYRAKGVSKDPAIGPKGWAALHRLAYAR